MKLWGVLQARTLSKASRRSELMRNAWNSSSTFEVFGSRRTSVASGGASGSTECLGWQRCLGRHVRADEVDAGPKVFSALQYPPGKSNGLAPGPRSDGDA